MEKGIDIEFKQKLIKLTSTEKFLQDSGLKLTLKEVANKYDIRHDNAMRDFKKMVATLSDDELNLLHFEIVKYTDKKGELRPTIEMDFRTTIFFVTKFDHNKRLNVINYAMSKVSEDTEKETQKLLKEANLPIMHPDGKCSVRRGILKAWSEEEDSPSETEVWDSLIEIGYAKSKAKVTISRVIPESQEGIIGVSKKRGLPTYEPKLIKGVWDKYVEKGKPQVSEYDRLIQEFKDVSDIYREKIEKLRQKGLDFKEETITKIVEEVIGNG